MSSLIESLIREYVQCVFTESVSKDSRIVDAVDAVVGMLPKQFRVEPDFGRRPVDRAELQVSAGRQTLLRWGVDPNTNGTASLSDGLVALLEEELEDIFERESSYFIDVTRTVAVFVIRVDEPNGKGRHRGMASILFAVM